MYDNDDPIEKVYGDENFIVLTEGIKGKGLPPEKPRVPPPAKEFKFENVLQKGCFAKMGRPPGYGSLQSFWARSLPNTSLPSCGVIPSHGLSA